MNQNKRCSMLRINEIRKQKGLTIQDLANKMGISLSAVNQQISGNPTTETLEKFAKALEVEIRELFAPSINKEEITALVDHRGRLYRANTLDDLQKIIDQIRQL